jgi:formate/nitrite transporter FocA (FNT family)
MTELAQTLFQSPFWTTALKGVFAGWLIALMVWLLPASKASEPLIIIILTYAITLGGFTHVIASTVDALFLVFRGVRTFGDFAGTFFLPTLLGNIVGGVMLVAVLNSGQVAPQLKGER